MSNVEVTGWVGWGRFAGVIIFISGVFGLLQGVVALIAPDPYFITTGGTLFLLDLSGWGWWHIVIGLLLMFTAAALFTGATWSRVIAIILCVLSAIGQLLLLPAQPWWSTIIIALDILVIYALTAHGRELAADV
jgi:hypothetical protein